MATAKIACPQCGKRFSLQAPDMSVVMPKTFRCPQCGYTSTFGQLMGMPSQPAPGRTQVASHPSQVLLKVAGGSSYSLVPGSYTLGRASSDSQATVKLAPDPYMSRLHARLDVSMSHSGPQCTVAGLSPTNPVYVNRMPLGPGEMKQLRNGDELTLGMTTITINC